MILGGERAIFLGIRAISNEVFIGTNEGIVKCRAVRRKPPNERWNIQALNSFKGVPWDMEARSLCEPSCEEQLKPLPASDQVDDPIAYDRNKQVRDFKILQERHT